MLALIVKVYKCNNSRSPQRRLDIDQITIAIAPVVWSGRSNLVFPLMIESFGARAVLPPRAIQTADKPMTGRASTDELGAVEIENAVEIKDGELQSAGWPAMLDSLASSLVSHRVNYPGKLASPF